MHHPGDRRLGARADVGGGARDRAGRRNSAEQRRGDVRDALRDQFDVGIVPVAAHPVGDDRRQQAFDRGEQRHRERRGQQRQMISPARNAGTGNGGRPVGIPPNLRADRFDRRPKAATPTVPSEQRHDRARDAAGHARPAKNDRQRRRRIQPPSATGDRVAMVAQHCAFVGRNSLGTAGRREPEKVLDLRRGDQQSDAVGEPDGDGPGNEPHRCTEPVSAHDDEHARRHHACTMSSPVRRTSRRCRRR